MRVWVLPDPGGSVTDEDRQLLAVGIAYLPSPAPPGHVQVATGGGYVPSPWVYEYEEQQRLAKREARDIEEIIIILMGLN